MESKDAWFMEFGSDGYLIPCPQQKALCKCGIAACRNEMTWYKSLGREALMADIGPREKSFLVMCFLRLLKAKVMEERMEVYVQKPVWRVDTPLAFFLELAENTFVKLTPEWAGYPLS
jgi:hypothetical protein